ARHAVQRGSGDVVAGEVHRRPEGAGAARGGGDQEADRVQEQPPADLAGDAGDETAGGDPRGAGRVGGGAGGLRGTGDAAGCAGGPATGERASGGAVPFTGGALDGQGGGGGGEAAGEAGEGDGDDGPPEAVRTGVPDRVGDPPGQVGRPGEAV